MSPFIIPVQLVLPGPPLVSRSPNFPNGGNHADFSGPSRQASRKARTGKTKGNTLPYLLSPVIINKSHVMVLSFVMRHHEACRQNCQHRTARHNGTQGNEPSIADRPLRQRLHVFPQRRRPSQPADWIT
jgi:hypothetical protein